MNSLVYIVKRNMFAAALLFAAAVLLCLAPKAAVNVDEMLHYPHAKQVVNWYYTMGNDASCLDTPVTNLKYYGQSVDNLTALINRVFSIENEYATRHFTGAFFFWLLLLFAGVLGRELIGSNAGAALVVLALLCTPRLFGQAFGNLKDIPFAAGYAAGIFFTIRFVKQLPKPNWANVFGLAFAIAFTCSVRIGGLILFAYLGVAMLGMLILKPFLLKYIVSTKPCFVRLLGQGLVIVGIGYFAGLLFWPYALQDVWNHPLESLSVMEHYKVSIKQIYQSEVIWSTDLPRSYLLQWMAITTPEFLLLGLIYIVAFLTYKFSRPTNEQLFTELFVLFVLVFPVVYVMIIHSNLYSGIRQMLFVVPMLVVLACSGVFKLINSDVKKHIRIPAIALFFLLMILPIQHQAGTFPVDYVYFNSISGGNEKAWSNYEYDYYFHGIKEASDYLHELAGDEEIVVALNCALSNYFEDSENITYKYTRYLERSSEDWNYGIFGVNYIHPTLLKNEKWNSSDVVKTFYHKGNPLVVLLKRKSKNDLKGIRALRSGDYGVGEQLLVSELSDNPNNVWLYVELARASILQADYEAADEFLVKGRQIYPYFEPFYVLEAQTLYARGRYQKAYDVLQDLLAINPRYNPAAALLKDIKGKINNKQLN